MSAFNRRITQPDGASLRVAASPAPKVVTLRPEQFASTWLKRPTEPVLVGLRVTSERDREGASIEAFRSLSTRKLDDAEQERCIASVYARIIAARGLCDPNNVLAAHPLLPLPDDQIAVAMPPSTIRWLFDEIDALNVAQSPGYSEATDEEIGRLCDVLSYDAVFEGMDRQRAARVRRLLWAVLTEVE